MSATQQEEATPIPLARPASRFAPGARTLPAVLFVVAAAVGTAAAQGGYFSTSWGWSTLAFVLAIEIWLVLSGRTDAGRLDVVFLGTFALFAVWVALSVAWSVNPAQSVQEIERILVILTGAVAFVVLVRRELVAQVTLVLVAGITIVAGYSLATRLFPSRLGFYDPVAVYRLSEPIGYWNGLGLFCAMGAILALGLAAQDDTSRGGRVVAGIALVLLPTTLYFTFSRGSVGAAAIALAITASVSPRRVRLACTIAVTAPVALLAVFVASRSAALTHRYSPITAVSDDGRRLTLLLVALALLQVAAVLGVGVAARRLEFSERYRRAAGAVVLGGLLVVLAGGLVRLGNPVASVQHAYGSFIAPAAADDPVDLNDRFASFSGNGRIEVWRYAWDEAQAHPLLGTGAGSFERAWQLNPNPPFKLRDAHTLYLETLAELGPVGLILLSVALLLPICVGIYVRRRHLTPYLAGAYGAFLVQAGIDWQWELGGVALTAMLIGVLMLASARDEVKSTRDRVRVPAILAAMAVAAVGLVGLLGNTSLSRAQTANTDHRYADAQADAGSARTFMPWSAQPWIAMGEAQYSSGDRLGALASFRHAVRIDDHEWSAWIDLAVAARGRERQHALDRARALFPGSRERKNVEEELAKSPS